MDDAVQPGVPSTDPLVGATISARYQIERVIGQGGMGVVYAGVQKGLDRPVAVKVLKPAYASDGEVIERMFREARAASQMGHPNICDVYDLGRLDDGRPFMVMPLLQGEDLATLIEATAPLDVARTTELLRGPAAALDVMHARGIIHRDIKPENMIRVEHADGSESVQLVDFGLATMLYSDSRLTREGIVCGTPHYLAPEAGGGELPDARGDVYALAVVAFEMLTGELPFDGPNPMTIVTQKMVQPPPKLNELRPGTFSPRLEKVLARGLAIDPADRYASAGELVEALANADSAARLAQASTLPVAGSVDGVAGDRPSDAEIPGLGRGASGRPVWWTAGVLVAAVLCAAGLWAATRSPAAPAEVPAEPAPEARVPEASSTVDDAPPVADDPAPVEASTEDDPAGEDPAAATDGTDDGATRARAGPRRRDGRPAPDRATRSEEDTTRAPVVTNDVTEGRTPLPDGPELDPDRAARDARLGTDALLRGQLAAAVRHLTAATRADPGHAPAWRGLGLARQRMGHHAEAARAYRRYLAIAPGAADAPIIRRRLADLSQ